MTMEATKKNIRSYALELGADVVGFAAIDDYHSPNSPAPETMLPGVKSIVVMGCRENDGALDSPNPRISMTSRMGAMELGTKNNYLLTRYIEKQFRVKAAPVPFSYPLDMGPETMGFTGDLSLRHAAVAAGLGVFGRHNLVIHPEFGSRIIFSAILTQLPLPSDPQVQGELCSRCNLCVEACPAKALDDEGKTDQFRCIRKSQPYGIGGAIGYIRKFFGKSPAEQKELIKDPVFLNLYQAQMIGFQYICWKCLSVCPACIP